MNSRVKKLYLVEENQLKQAGGGNIPDNITGGAAKSLDSVRNEQRQQVLANPLSNPLEREVWLLDEKVGKVLSNKTLPPPMKVLEYLRAIRKFIRLREELQQKESVDSTTPTAPAAVSSAAAAAVPESKVYSQTIQTDPEQRVQLDPRSVYRFGQEQKMYAEKNIVKNIAPNMKPRFRFLMKQLLDHPEFRWSEETGEMIIREKAFTGSDMRDLIVHKLKTDMNEASTTDAPSHYNSFESFLQENKISSIKETRKRKAQQQQTKSPAKKQGVVKTTTTRRGIKGVNKSQKIRDQTEQLVKRKRPRIESEDPVLRDELLSY